MDRLVFIDEIFQAPTTVASIPELRKFGWVMAIALVVLFGLFFPWLKGHSVPLWPWIAASTFALCAILVPRLLAYIHSPWMRLAHALGYVNTRIVLGVLFFSVVAPLGFLLRSLSKDPLQRKLDPRLQTYRITREAMDARAHMERPF